MPIFTEASDPTAIEALARKAWGEPNAALTTRDELRFGNSGSKAVKPKLGIWFDHEAGEGGHYRDLYKLANGTYPENGSDKSGFQVPGGMLREIGNPVAWWDYHDEQGFVVARVVRFQPAGADKTFRQCRPDGDRWIWKMGGLQVPLYRLPSLLHAPAGSLVYITEGEKHADRLREWGLIATTNAGGAGKFRFDHASALAGHIAIVLGDNDAPGRKHVASTLAALKQAGVTAHVLELPGLPEKGDVMDWIADGGTREDLAALTAEIIAFRPGSPRPDDGEADDNAAALRRMLSAEGWMSRKLAPSENLLGEILTTKGRMFLVGYAGLGKTMLGMAIAVGMATGTGFLDWRTSRPLRVLYLDGEMAREYLLERISDAHSRARSEPLSTLFAYCLDDAETVAEAFPSLGMMGPLNTEQGQQFVHDLIALLGGVDVVIFDNVMSLIIGDHKDEAAWSDTLPLIASLTRKGIAQIWLDHTGHNAAQQYGTSTKAWRFDAVGIMTRLNEANPRETAFTLSFDAPGKARRRNPKNWEQFASRVIRLQDDEWTSELAGSVRTGGETKLPDKPAILLRTLQNLDPALFEDIHPEPEMPLCKAVRRSKLRSKLIAEGWFPENMVMDAALNCFEKLKPTRAGYGMENNALSPLKRRGFINFNREWIWLL